VRQCPLLHLPWRSPRTRFASHRCEPPRTPTFYDLRRTACPGARTPWPISTFRPTPGRRARNLSSARFVFRMLRKPVVRGDTHLSGHRLCDTSNQLAPHSLRRSAGCVSGGVRGARLVAEVSRGWLVDRPAPEVFAVPLHGRFALYVVLVYATYIKYWVSRSRGVHSRSGGCHKLPRYNTAAARNRN
jgi:hypothetical protein